MKWKSTRGLQSMWFISTLSLGEGWLKMEVRKGTLLEKALFSGRQDILYRLFRFAQTKDRRYLNEVIQMVKVEGGMEA